MSRDALLVLSDGAAFEGEAVGHMPESGVATGEVVFNTALSGYQEILTDPSYCRQIVTLTYPHIGNTGTNREDGESPQVYASGLVIRDLPRRHSSWRAEQGLSDFLQKQGIVGICELDTRKLTRILREKGAQNGCIAAGDVIADSDVADAIARARGAPSMAQRRHSASASATSFSASPRAGARSR